MLTFLAPCGHPTALQPSAHAHEGCSFRLIPAVDPTTRERDLDRRMRAAMRCRETFLFDRGASPKLAGSLPHLLALPMVLLNGSSVSEGRLHLVRDQLAALRLDAQLVAVDDIDGEREGVNTTDTSRKQVLSLRNVDRALRHCANAAGHSGCLIFEDDAVFHPKFREELPRTLQQLDGRPEAWETLHLCPGSIWGRQYHNKGAKYDPATLFHVNPNEQYADPPSVRPDPLLDGRVLKPPPLPHGKYDKRRGSWLGAPTAFVIKRPAAAALAARIASATAEAPLEIDVVLYHDANRTGSTHRVAAEPQLCYEDEGHSAFDTNIGGGVDTHISEHPGGRKKLR